jgi:tRNA-dependent cyclodipeptide synthase
MELYKVRGGSREALENKEYNISVGISLGNKWFTPENIVSLIKWSLRYTKEYVVVCPADDIHAINVEVRHRTSKVRAQEIAKRMSEEIMLAVREEVEKRLTEDEKAKIIYAVWSDIVDEKYKKKVDYLYEAFEKNSDFRSAIQGLVKGAVSKEKRSFTDDDINFLSTYLLEELPEITGRVPARGYVYDAYAYPFDPPLGEFVERIQKGELFPEIGKVIMDTEPKVFLEVR